MRQEQRWYPNQRQMPREERGLCQLDESLPQRVSKFSSPQPARRDATREGFHLKSRWTDVT